MQRIAAAKRRARLYARRKLAGYVKPKPKPHPAISHGPRMNRIQTLRHLELACGVLPEEETDAPKVEEEIPAEFHSERPLGIGIDLLPAEPGDLIAENEVPPPPFNSTDSSSPGGPPVYLPSVGAPSGYVAPPGGAPPGKQGLPPATPPVSPVPEPGSYVLMFTGAVGAVGVVRRRSRSAETVSSLG